MSPKFIEPFAFFLFFAFYFPSLLLKTGQAYASCHCLIKASPALGFTCAGCTGLRPERSIASWESSKVRTRKFNMENCYRLHYLRNFRVCSAF